jgi:hypothetical protein
MSHYENAAMNPCSSAVTPLLAVPKGTCSGLSRSMISTSLSELPSLNACSCACNNVQELKQISSSYSRQQTSHYCSDRYGCSKEQVA